MRKTVAVFVVFVTAALATSYQAEAGGALVGLRAIVPLPGVALSPPRGNGLDALVIPVQDGGPDFFVVYRVPPGDKLNIREGIGTGHRVIARVPNGEVLRNLGCRSSGGSRWCQVETRDGRSRGWASNQFLHEAGGTAGSGGSSDVPEIVARSRGEIEVRWRSGCTMLYNQRGNRLQAGSSCSRPQRARSDDAVTRYLREQGGGSAGGGSSGEVPEIVARSRGEIEVRWRSGCTMLYNQRGNRLQAGSSCSRPQRARSDDAVVRYLREQGGSSAGGGGPGGPMDMRGNGAVTRGGPATGRIFSRNGRSYALIITASRDGFTCTGSFDRSPGSRDSMSTHINCTNGTSGTAILVARNNGYMLTFSTVSGAGGYVQFR